MEEKYFKKETKGTGGKGDGGQRGQRGQREREAKEAGDKGDKGGKGGREDGGMEEGALAFAGGQGFAGIEADGFPDTFEGDAHLGFHGFDGNLQ